MAGANSTDDEKKQYIEGRKTYAANRHGSISHPLAKNGVMCETFDDSPSARRFDVIVVAVLALGARAVSLALTKFCLSTLYRRYPYVPISR